MLILLYSTCMPGWLTVAAVIYDSHSPLLLFSNHNIMFLSYTLDPQDVYHKVSACFCSSSAQVTQISLGSALLSLWADQDWCVWCV